MRRPSHIIEDLVSGIDALAGKCHTASESEEMEFGIDYLLLPHMVADVALVGADAFLSGIAKVLEYGVARPAYYIENLVSGKQPSPGWVFD